jgi:WD40 repeat protein
MGSLDPKYWSVCRIEAAGAELVALGGDNGHISLWNPATGKTRKLGRGKGPALALCPVRPGVGTRLGARTVLASAGLDQTIWLWDPVSRREVIRYTGHPTERITRLCRLPTADGDLLVTAGHDGLIIVLEPSTGDAIRAMSESAGPVQDLCQFTVGGADRLASVGLDAVVRIWDSTNGALLHTLTGHDGWLHAVCTVTVDGRVFLASAGDDRVIRLWDPVAGKLVRAMEPKETMHTMGITGAGGGTVYALREVRSGDRVWLASGGDFPGVWLWDPTTGRGAGWLGWRGALDTTPECGWVRSLATYPLDGGPYVVTGGYDKAVHMFAAQGSRAFQGF